MKSNGLVDRRLRPEDVHLSAAHPNMPNVWEAVVDNKIFLGDHVEFQVKIGDVVLLSRVHPSFFPADGTSVYLGMQPAKCLAIAAN